MYSIHREVHYGKTARYMCTPQSISFTFLWLYNETTWTIRGSKTAIMVNLYAASTFCHSISFHYKTFYFLPNELLVCCLNIFAFHTYSEHYIYLLQLHALNVNIKPFLKGADNSINILECENSIKIILMESLRQLISHWTFKMELNF